MAALACRRLPLALGLALAAAPAAGHIKLTEPANFQWVGPLGDPQKAEPCGGAGDASNAVTEVLAGSTLTVRWTETIGHPGHFRIGIARDPAHFVTPAAVVTNSDCTSAPIEASPQYPTLVDGLLPHASASPGTSREATVTVPMMSCERCTLQLLQFMSSHAPPCFYFQCARLRIVMPDAGSGAAGASPDGGAGGEARDAGPGGADAGTAHHEHGGDVVPPPAGCGCGEAGPGAWLSAALSLGARRAGQGRRARGRKGP